MYLTSLDDKQFNKVANKNPLLYVTQNMALLLQKMPEKSQEYDSCYPFV